MLLMALINFSTTSESILNSGNKEQFSHIKHNSTNFWLRLDIYHLIRQVICFVSGLSDTIRTKVQANFRTNLSTAISLARLYEAKNQSQQKQPTEKSTIQPTKHQTTSTMSPTKRLNIDEINERKKLGLCFK